MQPARCINYMQPATNILDTGAEAGERIGIEIDVTEFDKAGPRRLDEPTALPLDTGVTDGAFGVVPDP